MSIAIIGCGNMGTGLAEQLSPFHSVFLYDRDWNHTYELAQRVKAKACRNLFEAIKEARFIILAIKPQNLKELDSNAFNQLQSQSILISLLAGTPLEVLKRFIAGPILVRMMPNIALCCGMGVIGLVDSPGLTPALKEELKELLTPLGLIYWIKENQIDSLTSLTGSGPAFIFTLIEAMIDAGVEMGFRPKEAQELIIQLLQGCAALLQKTGEHPAVLKQLITSPGGTTIAGLRALEKGQVRSGIIETFLAAYGRSKELAQGHEN